MDSARSQTFTVRCGFVQIPQIIIKEGHCHPGVQTQRVQDNTSSFRSNEKGGKDSLVRHEIDFNTTNIC